MTTIKLHVLMRQVGVAKSEFDAWEEDCDSNGKPLVRIRAIGGTSLTRIKVLLGKEGYKFKLATAPDIKICGQIIGSGFTYLCEVTE